MRSEAGGRAELLNSVHTLIGHLWLWMEVDLALKVRCISGGSGSEVLARLIHEGILLKSSWMLESSRSCSFIVSSRRHVCASKKCHHEVTHVLFIASEELLAPLIIQVFDDLVGPSLLHVLFHDCSENGLEHLLVIE